MSELKCIKDTVIPEVMKMLPASMDSLQAKAMILAIGLQESRFEHRVQIGGPAHGFWQFEAGGGVKGVLYHPSTRSLIIEVCEAQGVKPAIQECYQAIINDDILACAFARLLLYTLPGRLPNQNERDLGWKQYTDAWRPGMPHRETWDAFFDQAWKEVIT